MLSRVHAQNGQYKLQIKELASQELASVKSSAQPAATAPGKKVEIGIHSDANAACAVLKLFDVS